MKNKKVVALVLAFALVLGGAIGGTLAWLMDKTDEVKNTFTPANIDITLTETPNQGDTWTAQMVPGKEYDKDPVVTVVDANTDVDCWLFVRVVKTGNVDEYITYTSLLNEGNGWYQVLGTTDVWYRQVKESDQNKTWNLLDGNKVTVKDSLTNAGMPAAGTEVSLSYQAFAIQCEGYPVEKIADAWAQAFSYSTKYPAA